MNHKETLKKIKVMLGLEVKLEELVLDNGTKVTAEAFESGQEIFIVSEEGNVALPIGDYSLEDGRTISITEEGIIGEVTEASAEEDDKPEEVEVEAETEVEFVSMEVFNAAISEIKDMIGASKETELAEVEVVAEEVKPEAEVELEVEVETKTEVEVELEEVIHSPEAEVETTKDKGFRIGQKGVQSTKDFIFSMINK